MPKGLEFLYDNPQFAAMDYNTQKYTLKHLYARKYANDPIFQQMDDATKDYTLNTLTAQAAPVLQNPTERQQQKLQLAEAVRSGDEEAEKIALQTIGREAFVDQLSFVRAAEWIGKQVVEFVDPDQADAIIAEFNASKGNAIDEEKADAFLEESFPLIGEAKRMRRRKMLGEVGGFAADFAFWTAATQPLAAVGQMLVRSTTFGKATGVFAKSFSGAGSAIKSPGMRWFWQSAVPETLFNARGGLIGVARENILGNVERELGENPETFDVIAENAKVFGEYFIGDMIAFGAFSVLGAGVKFAGLGGKALVDAGKIANDDEFKILSEMFMKNRGVSPEEVAKLPRKQRQALERLSLQIERGKRVKDLPTEEKLQLFLYSKGYDIQESGKAFKIYDIAEDKYVDAGSLEEAIETAFKLGEDKFKFRGSVSEAGNLLGGSTDVRVSEEITAATKDLGDVGARNMGQLLAARGNKVQPNNARYVAKELLNKAGVRKADFNKLKVVEVEDYFRKGRQMSLDQIEIPKEITRPIEQERFVKNFLKQVEAISTSKGGSVNPIADARKVFANVISETPGNPLFVRNMAQKYTDGGYIRRGVSGEYELISKKGREMVGSMNDISQYLIREYVAPMNGENYLSLIAGKLAKDYGGKLEEAGGKIKVTLKGGAGKSSRMTKTFENVDDLLKQYPEFTPQIPIQAAPDINIISSGGQKFSVETNVVRGDRKQIAEFMNNFGDTQLAKKEIVLKFGKDGVAKFNKFTRKYRVELPDIGVQRVFDNLDDAKSWVNKGIKNFEDLDMAARYKGVKVDTSKTGFVVYDGKDKFFAESLSKAKDIVKRLPQPDWVGKELSGLDPDMVNNLSRQFREFVDDQPAFQESIHEAAEKLRKYAEKSGNTTSWVSNMQAWIAPTDINIRKIANELGRPDYLDAFNQMERARKSMEGGISSFHRLYERSIPKLDMAERERLGRLLNDGVEEADWRKVYQERHGVAMPEKSVLALTRIRDMLGRSKDDGLFAVFGIDGWKFLNEYFPRIKQEFSHIKGEGLAASAGEAIRMKMGWNKLPPEVSFFFDQTRTDDLLHFTAINDINEVMRMYVRKGFQKVHMKPAVSNMRKLLSAGDLPNDAFNRLKVYSDQVMNMHTTVTDQALKEATKKLTWDVYHKLAEIGLIKNPDKKVTDDIIGLMNQFTISATMAYRAWMPIRNLHQPLITIGSRFGTDVVFEAQKRAVRNAQDIVPRLKSRGVIPDKAPIMELVGDNFMTKFNHVGMKLYQDADAFNRAVADQVAEALMGDAAERFTKGWIDEKQFIRLSMLDRIDVNGRKEILETLQKGDFLTAQDIFSQKIIDETQFPYKAGTNPLMFDGTLGRLFGGFGHYPIYFVSNLARAAKNAPLGEKILTGGRFLATMWAMKKAWEVVGVDARNFTWYESFRFDGGPYYHLLNTALGATDASTYEGNQARTQLMRDVPRLFIPGFAAGNSAVKGLKALGNGDTLSAVESFLSMPVAGSEY